MYGYECSPSSLDLPVWEEYDPNMLPKYLTACDANNKIEKREGRALLCRFYCTLLYSTLLNDACMDSFFLSCIGCHFLLLLLIATVLLVRILPLTCHLLLKLKDGPVKNIIVLVASTNKRFPEQVSKVVVVRLIVEP